MLLIANIYSIDKEELGKNTIENNSAINSAPPSINDNQHIASEDEDFSHENPSDDESIADEDEGFDNENPSDDESIADEDEGFDDENPSDDESIVDEDEGFDNENPNNDEHIADEDKGFVNEDTSNDEHIASEDEGFASEDTSNDEHIAGADESFVNEDTNDDNFADEDDALNDNQVNEYTIKNAIDDVYGNIFTRSRTEEELISYLNTLIPDDSGLSVGVSNYAIKLHQQHIYNRVMATRNNYNTIKCQSLDFYKNNKFTNWNMASMGASHKKSIDKNLGYNNKSNNFIIGIDSHWSDYILGCSLGYDRSIGGTFTPEKIKRDQYLLQNSFLASIYVANYITNKLFCCAIVSLGSSRVKASRLREAAKMSSRYNTKFNKFHLSASYEFGLLLFNIEPEVIAKLTTINIDSYKNIPENNNISASNSEFHSSIKDQIFDIGLGVSITQTWMLYECFIVPKIKSTVYRNMNGNKTVAVNKNFMLEDYNTAVVNKYANVVETELGLDFSFKKVNLSIYYNFSTSKYYNDNSFAVKLNIPL
jgi:hypothetical protein